MEELFKFLLGFLASISFLPFFLTHCGVCVVRPWLTSEADHSGGSVNQRTAQQPQPALGTG